MDEYENQAWVKIGVSAALQRELASDARQFLVYLSQCMDRTLPGEAEIETRGLFSAKRIVGVAIQFGDERFTLRDPGKGPLVASRTKVVRGIAVKTEPMTTGECLSAIGDRVEERLAQTATDRESLAKALGIE